MFFSSIAAAFKIVDVNPFVPNAPFLDPLKTLENHTVFSCFQVVEKGCIENNWTKQTRTTLLRVNPVSKEIERQFVMNRMRFWLLKPVKNLCRTKNDRIGKFSARETDVKECLQHRKIRKKLSKIIYTENDMRQRNNRQ